MSDQIPVTVLTGFLGAGKTTLLNRILEANHGKRIAVVVNEFGEVGIDDALVVNADEEVFEMNNGCICCTVRGDLIRTLGALSRRRDQFDAILIETTGLADPGPVSQTFFMDDEIAEQFRLDAVVTMVDAGHVAQHLPDSSEVQEQIAFADVLVLNKTDLISEDELADLERRLRGMNALAPIHRAAQAEVELDQILDVGGFDLERVLSRKPDFLAPEYPFEWGGIYSLAAGDYCLELDGGDEPSLQIAIMPATGMDDSTREEAVRRFAEPAAQPDEGTVITPSQTPYRLAAASGGVWFLRIAEAGQYALFTEHMPAEFGLRLTTDSDALETLTSETFDVGHSHDEEVSSVGIQLPGSVDPGRLDDWLGPLLRDKGVDIFRSKGILNLKGTDRRYVFQGVHMLLEGHLDRPWGSQEEPQNQLVFIGRNLDRDELTEGFRQCLS